MLYQKEKTNSGCKHNSKVFHGIFNLTFRMLQHTSSEVTVTKYDEIKKTKTKAGASILGWAYFPGEGFGVGS